MATAQRLTHQEERIAINVRKTLVDEIKQVRDDLKTEIRTEVRSSLSDAFAAAAKALKS